MIDLKYLKDQALVAKNNCSTSHDWFTAKSFIGDGYAATDANFMAAASPSVVLELLDTIDRYREVLETLTRVEMINHYDDEGNCIKVEYADDIARAALDGDDQIAKYRGEE